MTSKHQQGFAAIAIAIVAAAGCIGDGADDDGGGGGGGGGGDGDGESDRQQCSGSLSGAIEGDVMTCEISGITGTNGRVAITMASTSTSGDFTVSGQWGFDGVPAVGVYTFEDDLDPSGVLALSGASQYSAYDSETEVAGDMELELTSVEPIGGVLGGIRVDGTLSATLLAGDGAGGEVMLELSF